VVHLTSREVTDLHSLCSRLQSPLAFPDIESWRSSVLQATAELLHADNVTFMLPLAGMQPVASLHVDPAAARDYLSYYCQLDDGHERRRRMGLNVATQRTMYGEDLKRTELYNDFFVPYRLTGGATLTIDFPSGQAAWIGAGGGAVDSGEDRSLAILNALLPHFDAGTRIARHLTNVREGLVDFCDKVPAMLAICDARGGLLHMNPRLREFVDHENGVATIRRIEHVAASLATGQSGADSCRQAGRIRSSASWIGSGGPGAGGYIAVVVETAQPAEDPALLREHFGLTGREAEVALLVAAGLSSKAIAAELSISWHTARRHTERILRKVGVARRAGVAAAISELRKSNG
jgi:DNA-binding CsgD family transcriptional regulator